MLLRSRLLLAHVAVLCLAGCTDLVGEKPPAAHVSEADFGAPTEAALSTGAISVVPHVGKLTLRDAVKRAIRYSPEIRAAYFEIQAKLGEASQAALRPNPEVTLDIENFAGSNELKGFDAAEGTIGVTQLVELGGKRYQTLAVAELDRSVSVWDFEVVRMRVVRETAEAFIDVLAIQEAIKRSTDATRIARDLERDIKARVDAGQANPIEVERTRPMVANTLVALESQKARLEPAKRRLASIWGQSRPRFSEVVGTFSRSTNVRSIDSILNDLDSNPQVAKWSEEIARRDAVVALEVAKSVPDVTFGAGLRRVSATDDTALVASASVPLPIFDRNAGSIAAAEARLSKAKAERLSSQTALRRVILSTYEELASTGAQVRALARDVVPPARSAYRSVQASFSAGDSQLLDVLDARRVLFEAELNLIRAQAEFEKAKVRIEAITGRRI